MKGMQPLMTEDDSPLADFYPLEFATDLNGKKQDWEALVLISFIDEVCRVVDMVQTDSSGYSIHAAVPLPRNSTHAC